MYETQRCPLVYSHAHCFLLSGHICGVGGGENASGKTFILFIISHRFNTILFGQFYCSKSAHGVQ